MIVLLAIVQAKSGKENELENLLKSLFPQVKEEKGTVEYVLHRAQDNAGRFFFYEKYKDKQAYDYHMSTAYLQKVFSNFAELVSGEPQVEMYEDIASIAY